MYITPITNYSFSANPIRILQEENKLKKYLYLDVMNLTRTEHFGANFHTKVIEIPEPTQKILDKLKVMNIKYEPITKKD